MSKNIGERGYTRADVLVSTEWVEEHLKDPKIRIAESNEDPLLYSSNHIPGAVEIDWTRDLNDPVRRDYLGRSAFDKLMRRIGATRETTIVLYGDKNNWWATYAFWLLQLFGHTNAKIMDGGRLKWIKENRPVTREVPKYQPSNYQAPERDDTRFRAFRDQTLKHMERKLPMIDVRSPEEYRGERLAYAGLPERRSAAWRTHTGSAEHSMGHGRSTRKMAHSRMPPSCGRSTQKRTSYAPRTT